MAEATRTALLNLNTLIDREFILIDGERFELANQGELSVLDWQRVAKKGAQVQALMGRLEDLTDDEAKNVADLLEGLCKIILRAPPEVHEKLMPAHKLLVVQAFNLLQRTQSAPPAGAEELALSSIGESRSQG